MGYGHFVEHGSLQGCVVSGEWERERRGMGGNVYYKVRYWAQIRDCRDAQYPIVCCEHEHREPEAALPCRDRLMRLVVRLAKPTPVGRGRQQITLTPDQIRGALKLYFAQQKHRRTECVTVAR